MQLVAVRWTADVDAAHKDSLANVAQAHGVKSDPPLHQQFTMQKVPNVRNYAVVLTICADSSWGWYVVGFLAVVGAGYAGGGTAWGMHLGRGQGVEAHPHHSRWCVRKVPTCCSIACARLRVESERARTGHSRCCGRGAG